MKTKSRHSYDQAYEQAVGRAIRFGQKKKVHVYQFLAVKTIDINIIEDRTEQIVANKQPLGNDYCRNYVLGHRDFAAGTADVSG